MGRGQSALEFMILVGALMFLIVGFLVVVQEQVGQKKFESTGLAVKGIAINVQDEINLASKASEGYARQFVLPNDINGLEYEINISDELVYVRTRDGRHAIGLPVSSVVGDVSIGVNLIEKRDGEILLNN
ncbi:hypothetical protein COU60_05560 [Candidatus Pacearchaeota archaeon CG10_big_fil_rev_8_21_14_0_10_34_76]|nr:MAG: hypothetical protein COU60_05560 [Candidatus Pacearchaeota archaeon CG10_big_fil_rev_8_21_14_0_10_34_76]